MLHGEYMVRISATHIDSARCGRPRRRAHARPVSPVTHHSHNISAGRSPGACAPGRERREPAGRGDTRGVRRDPRLPPRGATVSRTAERTDSDTRPAGQPARPNWLGLGPPAPAPTRNFDRNSVRRTSDDCPRVFTRGDYSFIHWRATARHDSVSQSQLLSRSCPRAHPSTGSPRIRLRRCPGLTASTEYAPASRGAGATQLSQVRSISPVMTVHMPCQILYAQSQFTCLSSLRCETAPSRSSLASTLKHCARESPIPDRPARRSRRLHAPRPR